MENESLEFTYNNTHTANIIDLNSNRTIPTVGPYRYYILKLRTQKEDSSLNNCKIMDVLNILKAKSKNIDPTAEALFNSFEIEQVKEDVINSTQQNQTHNADDLQNNTQQMQSIKQKFKFKKNYTGIVYIYMTKQTKLLMLESTFYLRFWLDEVKVVEYFLELYNKQFKIYELQNQEKNEIISIDTNPTGKRMYLGNFSNDNTENMYFEDKEEIQLNSLQQTQLAKHHTKLEVQNNSLSILQRHTPLIQVKTVNELPDEILYGNGIEIKITQLYQNGIEEPIIGMKEEAENATNDDEVKNDQSNNEKKATLDEEVKNDQLKNEKKATIDEEVKNEKEINEEAKNDQYVNEKNKKPWLIKIIFLTEQQYELYTKSEDLQFLEQ